MAGSEECSPNCYCL